LALVVSRQSVRGRKNNRKKSDEEARYRPPKVRLALAFLTGGARCLRGGCDCMRVKKGEREEKESE